MLKTTKLTTGPRQQARRAALIRRALAIVTVLVFAAGCGTPRPRKPGSAKRVVTTTASPTNNVITLSSEITQAEDPATPSSQFSEKKSRLTLPLPAATRLIERSSAPDEAGKTISTEKTIVLAAPSVQTLETEEKYGATLGAAQKDESRSLAAGFQNMRPVQLAGLAMIIGAGALGYFTGRWKAPAIIAASGLGLVLVAHLIVGHEMLVLGAGLGASLLLGLYEAHLHNFFAVPPATTNPSTTAK
jgi:hypothetical protein